MTEPDLLVGDDGPRFRLATAGDLPMLAKIHKIAYSHSHFTALLPDEVLMRYYSYFLGGRAEISLALSNVGINAQRERVAEEVQGFAVYGEAIPERIAAFKRECFKDIFLASLRHPWIAARKAMFAAFSKFAGRTMCQPAEFLLLSIAVAVPRCGIGSRLLNSMLGVARQSECRTVGLYVNAENVGAINAYFSAGFVMKDFQGGQFYMEQNLDKT